MSLRCDKCGKFCARLWDVPAPLPEWGIDYEVCERCARWWGLVK